MKFKINDRLKGILFFVVSFILIGSVMWFFLFNSPETEKAETDSDIGQPDCTLDPCSTLFGWTGTLNGKKILGQKTIVVDVSCTLKDEPFDCTKLTDFEFIVLRDNAMGISPTDINKEKKHNFRCQPSATGWSKTPTSQFYQSSDYFDNYYAGELLQECFQDRRTDWCCEYTGAVQ